MFKTTDCLLEIQCRTDVKLVGRSITSIGFCRKKSAQRLDLNY